MASPPLTLQSFQKSLEELLLLHREINNTKSPIFQKYRKELIQQFVGLTKDEKREFFDSHLITEDDCVCHFTWEPNYHKILCSLLMSLAPEEGSIISNFLGDMYTLIENNNDNLDNSLNHFLIFFSSKNPKTTLYFIKQQQRTTFSLCTKFFCKLSTAKHPNLDLSEEEILYCQLKNGIVRHFKIDPFPCLDCQKQFFDPTEANDPQTPHTCVFPVFRCEFCFSQFVPFEPRQNHCGCRKSYHPKTEIGQQIKNYLLRQKYLLKVESLTNFRYEINELIVSRIRKPQLDHIFCDLDDQMKNVHSSIALSHKIEQMEDHKFVALIKQKIVEINKILIELFEQSFFCYFCQQEGYLSEKQNKFIRCNDCHQIACHIHQQSTSSHCQECDQRLSFQSLESFDIAIHKVQDKKKIEKLRKQQKPNLSKRKRHMKPKISIGKSWRPLKKH